MTGTLGLGLFFGAVVGAGVFLVVRGLVAAGPALDVAIARLHPRPQARARSLTETIVSTLRLTPPYAEMRLIGQSMDRYVLEKVGYPIFGLIFPALMTELLSLLGVHLRWYLPTIVSLAFAVGLWLLVDHGIKQKAAVAREEFRRVIATYLTLVGLVRYAGAGAVESLEVAARVCDGWVFERIREALDDARYSNEAPWTRLRAVSDRIGVPDLGEVGDIMSLVGDQGAQVYQTLIARAQSMRAALRTAEQQRAATATTLLYVPTSLLLLVFVVLIGFPAITRIL
jgi:tight adherence protein C